MKVGDLVEYNTKLYKGYEILYPGVPHVRHFGIVLKVHVDENQSVNGAIDNGLIIETYLSDGKVWTFKKRTAWGHGLRLLSDEKNP